MMERSIGRDHGEVLREEFIQRQRILDSIRGESLTIPEISDHLGIPSRDVVFWVMSMWRYGLLVESAQADDDGYYRYSLPKKAEG